MLPLGIFACLLLVQCAPKVGCPSMTGTSAKMDKKGNLPVKAGKTQLFDKRMRKCMKKG